MRAKSPLVWGFKDRRATPSIIGETKTWTPDLIVWSEKMILIIECKGGKPSENDLLQAKTYSDIPQSVLSTLTGLSRFQRKVVLLYFKNILELDSKAKEALMSKSALEKDILIWACEKGFSVTTVQGNHDEDELNSLLKGGLDLPHFLSQQIEIQPDSPIILLEKLLFTKLWERAFRYKDTRFTIGTAREILENHNYALKNLNRRLNDAINSGENHGLCISEQPGQVWKLNFIIGSPPSIQTYLRKLKDVLKYPELQGFSEVDN